MRFIFEPENKYVTRKMTERFPRPLRTLVREYVGCDLMPLVHLYNLVERSPSVLDGGVAAVERLVRRGGLATDVHLFVQNLANVCAAFYEIGFIWLKTLPIRFNVTMALCFALYRGNLAIVQKYHDWAAEIITEKELQECDSVHNNFINLCASETTSCFSCCSALQIAAVDTGNASHFRLVGALLHPCPRGATRIYSPLIHIMLAARGQIRENSEFLTDVETRAAMSMSECGYHGVISGAITWHSPRALANLPGEAWTALLDSTRSYFTALCFCEPPMEVVEIMFERGALDFYTIERCYNPPEKNITQRSFDFLKFVVRKFNNFEFVRRRWMACLPHNRQYDLYCWIMDWARSVIPNGDPFWGELLELQPDALSRTSSSDDGDISE